MRTKTVAVATAIALGLPGAADAAQGSNISPRVAEQSQWSGTGVTVTEAVPQTAAASAGIRHGDVVVSINGRPVNSYSDIDSEVAASGGRPITIDLYQGRRRLRLQPRAEAAVESIDAAKVVVKVATGKAVINAASEAAIKIGRRLL